MDYQGRQAKLEDALAANRLDALLVTHLPNIRYLCGFTGSAAALLVTSKGNFFFSDGRYIAQAKAEVQGCRISIGRKGPLVMAGEWLLQHRRGGRTRLGLEGEYLSAAAYGRLEASLGEEFRLSSAAPFIEQARMVKESDEIARMREAARLGASLFPALLRTIRPGVSESEVAGKLEYAARRAGAEGMSFPTIVASGERSSLPHGRASQAAIPRRGFVTCDFGVILAGYCSDMTRTVHVGRPTPEARRVYQAVLDAQLAAIELVRPGQTVGEVDHAARNLLKKRGLERYFTHSTGHGVGLEIHEAPRVGAKQNEVLRSGIVITIEPGIYIPGKWGVRIEDTVVVTNQGCEILTPTSKELTIV
jgi:Xaa-Pro aminopeptidase